jgi:hypothetical protein
MQRAAEGKEREVQAVPSVPEGKNPDDYLCCATKDLSFFLMINWRSGSCKEQYTQMG